MPRALTKALLLLTLVPLAAAASGTGQFSRNVNWELTPALRYSVLNGPPNTCGDAYVTRNGTLQVTPGWLCTDANGYANKGPWYWADQPGDETAQAYIRWPNGTTTTTDWHIWDKQCPSVTIGPAVPPPSDWGGNASDPAFGACLGSYSRVYAIFQNLDTGLYSTGFNYSDINRTKVYGSFASLPSCSTGWSMDFPGPVFHSRGQRYRWTVCVVEHVTESLCEPCKSYEFTY